MHPPFLVLLLLMSFLNPQYLYGLVALVIPVLIHLFNLRKTKKVYFSNTRFLRMAKERSARKRKLKHYLILLSRLLFITFLVLAFAQPFLPPDEAASSGDPVIIYLDNSYSMSNEVEEDLTALEQAVDYITSMTSLLPEGTKFRLVTNDFLPGSPTLESAREIEEQLTELGFSGNTRSYQDVYRRIHSFQEEYGPVNIFWISDFQSSTADSDALPEFLPEENVQLIPLQFSQIGNVFVDSLYLENPLMIGDQQLKLYASLRNIGPEGIDDLIIKVYLDEVQSATASVNIPPNGNATVAFDLAFTTETERIGRVSIEEFPVTFDNDFYFTISKPEKINILEIKEGQEVTPVESVYGNEELFEFNSYSAANLDYNLLNNSSLVTLSGVRSIDAPLASALNRYMERGGHVLLLPAPDPDILSYQQLLGTQDLEVMDSASSLSLEIPDFNNPFYANIFEERNTRMEMPRAVPVLRWQNQGVHLLSFNAGSGFLSQRGNQHKLYMMSSPLVTTYNGFVRHALFVPVMYKIAAGSIGEGRQLYRYMDETTFSLPASGENPDELYKLVQEDFEIIPQQRKAGNRVFFDIPQQTLSTGYYTLVHGEEQTGQLAFNFAPEESDLRQLTRDELQLYFQGPEVALLDIDDTDTFRTTLEERFVGRNLWKFMVIAALLALLAEVALIQFMS